LGIILSLTRFIYGVSPNHGTQTVLLQLVSLAGAALILAAYLANSRKWLGPQDRSYNLLNLVGGGLLLWVAVVEQLIGFVILEAAWALIAIPPLLWPGKNGDGAPAETATS
jgi:hypothetical protein